MRRKASEDKRTASRLFRPAVWPYIQERFPGAVILRDEDNQGRIDALMDRETGIDWHFQALGQHWHFAVRLQWSYRGTEPGRYWRTFTIRAARGTGTLTEWSKLQRAFNGGSGMPHRHLQGYFSEPSAKAFLGLGLVDSRALIGWLIARRRRIGEDAWAGQLRTSFDEVGKVFFDWVSWDELTAAGIDVWERRPRPLLSAAAIDATREPHLVQGVFDLKGPKLNGGNHAHDD